MFNLSTIKQTATRAGFSGLRIIKNYSPEILTTVGIVGVVATTVMASRATLQVEPVIEKINQGKAAVSEIVKTDPTYTDQDRIKDLTRVYTIGVLDLARLYGPTLSMGVASISCLLGAHGIMRRRNATLLAAYKTLEEGYKQYRARVVRELGDDRERDIAFDLTEIETEDEKGKKKTMVSSEATSQIPGYSPYARFFDRLCSPWEPVAEYNITYVNSLQNQFNDKLAARGYVFLNEVYKALGIPETKAGQIVGWTINGGDGFIDFGMYDPSNEKAREFVNGLEEAILLDFNVQGSIIDEVF